MQELFGPLSLAALERDEYRRATAGYAPEAELLFIDEVCALHVPHELCTRCCRLHMHHRRLHAGPSAACSASSQGAIIKPQVEHSATLSVLLTLQP